MADIKMAVQAEKEYLRLRMADPSVSLLDMIAPYGYTSINEYGKDKLDYWYKSLNGAVYRVDQTDLNTKLETSVHNKENCTYIVNTTQCVAWNGSEYIDADLCARLGVEVHNLSYKGGTIITGSEDFNLVIIMPENINIDTEFFMRKFYSFYKKYYSDVEMNHNDILVNGYKIMGAMQRHVNGMYLFATQVSFANHLELVNQICPSDSGKIAGNFDSSLFTKQQLEAEVLSWQQ